MWWVDDRIEVKEILWPIYILVIIMGLVQPITHYFVDEILDEELNLEWGFGHSEDNGSQ